MADSIHGKSTFQHEETAREVIRWLSHIGALLPLLIIIVDFLAHDLTANPIQAVTQRTGRNALELLLIMLTVSPILSIYKTRLLSGMRKRLGLYAFFYASIHLLIFSVLDFGLNWQRIYIEITHKIYIIPGMIAFTILLALAVTSFQGWKKRLAKNWKKVHRLVYLAMILIILHYALGQKGDLIHLRGNLIQPIIFGIITLLILLLRLSPIRKALHWIQIKIVNGKGVTG